MERKKKLRKHIATLKTHYNSVLRKSLSTQILAALEAHPVFRAASTVLLYYSLKDEVETHTFVQKWSKKKRILLPVVVDDDLELRIYTGPEDMATGSYGIEEPTGELFTDYATIDFIAVPGVAFDRKPSGTGKRILRSTFTTHTISLQSRYLFSVPISRRSSCGIFRHPHGYYYNHQRKIIFVITVAPTFVLSARISISRPIINSCRRAAEVRCTYKV